MKRLDLPRLQKEQLQIMDLLHQICVDNSIVYYIIGGTALGAVRHGGFIPWDVDIDVAMPRKDYLNFQTVVSNQCPIGYSFVDFKTDKNCHTNHGFFVYQDENVKAVGGGAKYGVFIDIFPLDVAPSDTAEQIKHANVIKRLRFLQKYFYRSNSPTDKKTLIKAVLKPSLRFVQKVYSLQRLNSYIEKVMMRYYGTQDDKFWCSMCSHYSYKKQCMSKQIYGEPSLYKFENRQYYGPERIKDYLRILYGDYMKLPSIEEQNRYFED